MRSVGTVAKTAGSLLVSQLPLIPSVLLAEEAELERAADAVFESFKMQRQARAAAQRSSRARGCASRLAGAGARASRSASIGFLHFGGFSYCFWAASCSAMFDSAVMVTPFFCLHPEAVYPFSQCGGCTNDPQFFPSKQKMTKYYFFSFIHRIR